MKTTGVLRKLYIWLLFLPGVFPLFYKEEMMYPMLAPKTLIFYATTLLAVALFIYLICVRELFYIHRLKKWWTWIPAGLLGSAYISSFIGIDFYHSFWSTFERGDGLLTLTAVIFYFYLILLSVENSWLKRFLILVACTGIIASGYVLLQWLFSVNGFESRLIPPSSGRFGGTFGNASFFSAYAAMALFAVLYTAREYKGALKNIFYLGAVMLLSAIFIAATRGTLIALILVGIGAGIYLSVKGVGKIRVFARVSMATLVILGALFFMWRESLSQSSIEPLRRLASISITDTTVASRLFVWKHMTKAVLKNIFLGIGAGHVDIYFNQFYDPSLLQEEWFDKSHNVYLDYIAQYGAIGLLLYLALLFSLLWIGWHIYKMKERAGIYVVGITAVYGIQNFFLFDTISTGWFIIVLFAGASVVFTHTSDRPLPFIKSRKKIMGGIAGVAILTLIIPTAVTPWRANALGFQSYLYQVADVPRSIANIEKGLSLRTYADLEYGYNAYFMYTENQRVMLKGGDIEMAYKRTRSLLEKNAQRYPYDVRTLVYFAQVLMSAPSEINEDKAFIHRIALDARDGSPKRLQPWYILTNLSIGEANLHPEQSFERREGYKVAVEILENYSAIVPNLAEPYFVVAQLYYALNDKDSAAAAAFRGKSVYVSNLNAARRAVVYYEIASDISNAEFFLEEVLRLDPTDEGARTDLELIRQSRFDS